MKDDTSPATKADMKSLQRLLTERFDRIDERLDCMDENITLVIENLCDMDKRVKKGFQQNEKRIKRLELRVGISAS